MTDQPGPGPQRDADPDPGPAGAARRQRGDGVSGPPVSGADPTGRRGSAGGADLARRALEAARAANAAARSKAAGARRFPRERSGTGTVARRMSRRRWSGPGPDKRRDPQPIGQTVQSWVAGTGAAKELAKAALFTRWTEIVGAQIADHCRPVSLVDGELVLQAESTAWATQLRMLAGTMVKRINGEIGRGTVTHIRAKGPAGPSWRFGNRHVPGRGPRDTYG